MEANQKKPRRQLPAELVSEIAKCVPLKIASTTCVKPVNEPILLTNWSFTTFLRKLIRQRLDMIAQVASDEVCYDEEDWYIYRMIGDEIAALDSLTLMRHLYLGSLLYTASSDRGHFTIRNFNMPEGFQPAVFLELQLAMKTPNLGTMAQYVEFVFPRPKELPASFKRADLEIETVPGGKKMRLKNKWVEDVQIEMIFSRIEANDYVTAIFKITQEH